MALGNTPRYRPSMANIKTTILKTVPEAPSIDGCSDYRCIWCSHGEEHIYGLTPIELRKRMTEMTQAQYKATVVYPPAIIN